MRLSLALLALSLAVPAANAQTIVQKKVGSGGSPHVQSDWKVDGANVSLEYGRPSLKGRAESQMMPVGKPWRTGADEATVITTDKALTFGKVTLAPGSYTINTVPGDKEWHIVFGTLKAKAQWGVPYQKELEIGRVPMKLGKAKAPVEMVTYSIDARKPNKLRIEWGTVSVAAPFTVKRK